MILVNLCYIGLRVRKMPFLDNKKKSFFRVVNQAGECIKDFDTRRDANQFVKNNTLRRSDVV